MHRTGVCGCHGGTRDVVHSEDGAVMSCGCGSGWGRAGDPWCLHLVWLSLFLEPVLQGRLCRDLPGSAGEAQQGRRPVSGPMCGILGEESQSGRPFLTLSYW